MKFDRQLKSFIGKRSWEELLIRWVEFIPDIDPPGSQPDVSLSTLMQTNYAPFTKEVFEKESGAHYLETKGVRKIVLREGIFLLHKACHLLRNAELDISHGVITWSLSEAYQSAYYGAQAILSFLGVAYTDINGKSMLIDLWPAQIRLAGQKPKPNRQQELSQFVKTVFIEQRHLWNLFQRILFISEVSVWPEKILSVFRNLDTKKYPKQRNIIHYSKHRWLNEDLYKSVKDQAFGKSNDSLNKYSEVSDYSFAIGAGILFMGIKLISSLSTITGKLGGEVQLLMDEINSPQHDLFNAQVSQF